MWVTRAGSQGPKTCIFVLLGLFPQMNYDLSLISPPFPFLPPPPQLSPHPTLMWCDRIPTSQFSSLQTLTDTNEDLMSHWVSEWVTFWFWHTKSTPRDLWPFETIDQSDEETWLDQHFDKLWQFWHFWDNFYYNFYNFEIFLQFWDFLQFLIFLDNFRIFWLVTFETLNTFLTNENLNSWQYLLPDN